MSHKFYEGTIYHKRFNPKLHKFTYKFFMIDIDVSKFDTLKNKYFSQNRFNLFSFHTKDHFGESNYFKENVKNLLKQHLIEPTKKIRFITLPSILGYVFNPISVLILFENDNPMSMIVEVHNYHGGRVIYDVTLESKDGLHYKGITRKDMYVSPFFKRDGKYEFDLIYTNDKFSIGINLFENDIKMLTSTFVGKSIVFNEHTIISLFFRHTFLTVWVVTRTIWQSLKLKIKGLKWNKPEAYDKIRRD
jgi:uncharacterized protein